MKPAAAIHYDPRLIEETVFHAQRDRYLSVELEEARNRIYEVADADERENLFIDLYRSWFVRLRLGRPVEQALQEQAVIIENVENCFIVRATQAKEEGAELFVAQDVEQNNVEHRTLRVLLRPESLFNTESLTVFLRHELFHIADMLDPTFGYEPTLPKAEGGPTYDTLITSRYRALWDATINGRMLRRGWCDATVREQQFSDFVHAFPMLQDRLEELFSRFFDSEEPKHTDLARFAFDPRQAADSLQRHAAPGTHCPLCKFPTHAFEAQPNNLGADVLAAINEDFPNWAPSLGLCTQCADLYRARQMSMAALKLLPGWTPSAGERERAHDLIMELDPIAEVIDAPIAVRPCRRSRPG